MPRTYIDEPVPVFALATPLSESALALIRSAGPGAIELFARLFSRPRALAEARGNEAVYGRLLDPATGEVLDEVVATVFRAPKSSTGEDQVEVSCHGSLSIIRRVLSAFEAAGFAPALPGEFSFRAFVNGKTDLVRAEAVNELVSSRSDAARADALARLEGGLSRRLEAAREGLLGVIAEVELRLDYGEDEAEGKPSAERLSALRDGLAALAGSFRAGRLLREGLRVALAGAPNAGKSRLFNLFLREERSIVSPEPGTTRDWIEAELELGGNRLRLIDTAGLRKAEGSVELEGVARSERIIGEAELLLYLVDASSGRPSPADLAFLESHPRAIPVWNKIDLPGAASAPAGFLPVSASTGSGFPELAEALSRAARAFVEEPAAHEGPSRGEPGRGPSPEPRLASERQKALLDRALASIDAALAVLVSDSGLDAAALELKEAAESLGEITGEISSPEILEAIFSRFCVGK